MLKVGLRKAHYLGKEEHRQKVVFFYFTRIYSADHDSDRADRDHPLE